MQHISCIICSDLINPAENIYFTRCGHVFHYHCLSKWIERSKSCPQCRHKVTDKCIHRVYFNLANNDAIAEDATTLQSKLDDANFRIKQKDIDLSKKEENLEKIKTKLKNIEDQLSLLEQKLRNKETAFDALKQQFEYIKVENRELDKTRKERDTATANLSMLQGLQKVLNDTAADVEAMMETGTDLQTVCTFATALKKALVESESKRNELRNKLQSVKSELATEKKQTQSVLNDNRVLEDHLRNLLQKLKRKQLPLSVEIDTDDKPNKIARLDTSDEISIAVDEPSTSSKWYANDENTINSESRENISMNTLVNNIEHSDSPYLMLKQSNALINAVSQRTAQPAHTLKPSEFALFKPQTQTTTSSPIQFSISQKRNLASNSIFKPSNNFERSNGDVFSLTRPESGYDGLGGHSKPDVFPVPRKSPIKSCVPKVTARHRLKRPEATANGSIAKFMRRLS